MNQSKSNSIQGLRFWAIGLIVASHCGFLSQGGLGNCIFFAMSGFFACQPFADDDYEYGYFSPANFIKYYIIAMNLSLYNQIGYKILYRFIYIYI